MRQSVIEARQAWRGGCGKLREVHEAGAAGLSVCNQLSGLLESVLIQICQTAFEEISPDLGSRVSLTLLGGCGRGDIAPFSDVDLMLLYQGSLTDDIVEFSRRISQDITDSGLQLGFSCRTPREACTMSLTDAYIFSSLTEARLLLGNSDLFENFLGRFQRMTSKKNSSLIKAIIAARAKERHEYGETVYLLRPNVKRSRGALRDIHLIRWLGFVRFGETEIEQLLAKGAMSTADSTQLLASREFLLRVRNEMHFHANRANDGLERGEQVRVAKWLGYAGDDALLSVEEFMRDYFRYTSRVSYICEHFINKSLQHKQRGTTLLGSMMTKQIDEHFHVGPTHIGVSEQAIDEVKTQLGQVLRLMQLSCLHEKSIEHGTWIAIRHEMLKRKSGIEFNQDCARRFMALLSNTKGLGNALRRLHEMTVLKNIIPEFAHARGLLQFNEYHKYTVDEHSLRALEHVISFEQDRTIIGETYRSVRDKKLLHLALLLHDLGKGFPEDHSEVGRRIAQSTGERFGLPEEDTETIMFLVHNHLVMSHLAFHRDIFDESMVAEFAANVGSLQMLSMLYVLTLADIKGVGPDVLTPWKLDLLTNLFRSTRRVLTGDHDGRLEPRLKQIYDRVSELGADEEERAWLLDKAASMPNNYCLRHSVSEIAERLLELKNVEDGILCWVNPIPETRLVEIAVAKSSSRRAGVFHKVAGTVTGMGLQIHGADIKPIGDDMVWYWIQFEDQMFNDVPPESRLEEIRERVLEKVFAEESWETLRFPTVWKKEDKVASEAERPEIQVKIDNDTVSNATVVDVFSSDKAGLLYKIARKIHQLQLDVTYARTISYGIQVVGVYYLTDDDGNKIRDRNRLLEIQAELQQTLVEFLDP